MNVNKIKFRGFTFIELMMIVAIIMILATAIIWNINSARIKSRDKSALSSMNSIVSSSSACMVDVALPETRRIGDNLTLSSVCIYHNGTDWVNANGYSNWPTLSAGWTLPTSASGLYCRVGSNDGSSCGNYDNNTSCGGNSISGKFCIRAEADGGTKVIWCTEKGCEKSGF